MFKNSIKSIKIVYKSAPSYVILKIASSILFGLLVPFSFFLTEQVLNGIVKALSAPENIPKLLWNVFFLVVTLLLVGGGGRTNTLLDLLIQKQLKTSVTAEITEKYLRLDYPTLVDPASADTINRMGKNPSETLYSFFSVTIDVLSMCLTILGITVFFATVSLGFAVVYVLVTIAMLWADFRSMNDMNTMFNTQSRLERRLYYLSSLLSEKQSLFELQLFGSTDYIFDKQTELNDEVFQERKITTIKSQKYFLLTTFLLIGWSVFVVFSLLLKVQNHAITLGLFVSVISSVISVFSLNSDLSYGYSRIAQGSLNIEHYYQFHSFPEEKSGNKMLANNPPLIEFKGVHFTYPGTTKEILKGVTFSINPKDQIALVGENGSGKSTIIKLLLRLYAPTKGKILLDGIEISELSREELTKTFGVVFQDFERYQLTLRENIAFGDISLLQEDAHLLSALHKIERDSLVEDLPHGLDSSLGRLEDSSTDLSGGQWQKIAFARGNVGNKPFIILDEPTAALDPLMESKVYESFLNSLETKGGIIISHRLGSARIADSIIVLSDGIISERGSHDELIKQEGIYATMFQLQKGWYTDDTVGQGGAL